jgi:CRP/FNR family transcriptional regulator, nitrogen oxide reductase regulator
MPLDIQLLAGLPVFEAFSPADLAQVLAEARSIRFAKGAMVFEQGAQADLFFLLVHGRVRAYRLTPDGQQIVLRFVGPGELFGIAMAIGSPTYPANAVAVVESVAIVWPVSAWKALAARFPALALSTMQTMGGRLQEAHTRMTEMATEEVARRVAHTLLRLAQQAGRKTKEGVLIDFPISRQDIAEMSSTTLHTVSRIMSAWEQEGLVESGRQRVLLRDPHRIHLIAESSSE